MHKNILDALGLSARKTVAVRALLESDAADKALRDAEEATNAKRRALIEARARVSAPYLKPMRDAVEAATAATQHREATAAALTAAIVAESKAIQASLAVAATESASRNTIDRELEESADPRIATYDFVLDCLDDAARAAITFYPVTNPTVTKPQHALEFNTAEVKAAREAIRSCRDRCASLRYDVAGYADVTAAFEAMCEALLEPLAALELNPPQVDAEGSIGKPLRWEMRRRAWRVDTLWNEPRQPAPIVDQKGRKVTVGDSARSKP